MTSNRIQNVLGSITKLLECAICLDVLKKPVITKCNHSFCRFCITEFLKNKKSVPCPLCKEAVTKRSLQEQDRLNEIVTHVNGLIQAYQEDTGELFSPPRGQQVDNAFFPCTPEPIFSQQAVQQPQHRRQRKRNVKHTEKRQARQSPEEREESDNASAVHEHENCPQIQESHDVHASTSTRSLRRGRHPAQTTTSNDEIHHGGRHPGQPTATHNDEFQHEGRHRGQPTATHNDEFQHEGRHRGQPTTTSNDDVRHGGHHTRQPTSTRNDEFQHEGRHRGQPTTTSNDDVRHGGHHTRQPTSTRNDDVLHGTRSSTRNRSDVDKEKALLQYLDEGSCGRIISSRDSDSDDDSLPAVRLPGVGDHSKGLDGYQATEANVSDKLGYPDEDMEVDLNTEIENDNISLENLSNNPQDIRTDKDLHPVCVIDKMTVEDLQDIGVGVTAARDSSQTKDVLELTPESEYEGEDCDLGDEFLLFQSQEVKQKEQPQKVKLNIYSGKKLEPRNTRSNNKQGQTLHKQQYEADFDIASTMSSLDTPQNLGREFQSAGQVKTYGKSRVEKNKKITMVKQWVQKTQEATTNHAFSESDSQTSGNVKALRNSKDSSGHEDVLRNGDCGTDFDDFGFNSLVDSSEQDVSTKPRNDTSTQDLQGTQNRKKIFKTRTTKESVQGSVHIEHTEIELPPSDPYEFKSSQNSQTKQVNQTKGKRGKKQGKGKKGNKTSAKMNKNEPRTKASDVSKTTRDKVAGGQDKEDWAAIKTNKKMKGRKEKHVHFDLKSPEEEMSHLINKIGEAEDHDFLFSTQDALSNMTEQEEDEDVLPLEEDDNVELVEDVNMTEADRTQGDGTGRTDAVSQGNEPIVSDSNGTEKSVVPPTPLLSIPPVKLKTKNNQLSNASTVLTVVPQTPVIQILEDEIDKTKTGNCVQKEIHLTDSESCNQMPLPIPRKKKVIVQKKKSVEVPLVQKSPSHDSEQSHISPTPDMRLKRQDRPEVAGSAGECADEEPSSDDSSSTEDLDITLDNTQIEEPNLDLQPEDIRKRLSQESVNSASQMSKTQEGRQNPQHQEEGISMDCHNDIPEDNTRTEPRSEVARLDIPPESSQGDQTADEELTVVADTVGNTKTPHDLEKDGKKLKDTSSESVIEGSAYVQSGEVEVNDGKIEKDVELSLDIIEDTMESSNISTRSGKNSNRKGTNKLSMGLRQRVTRKCAKNNKLRKESVIEIEDSEEETATGAPVLESSKPDVAVEKETCVDTVSNISAVVNSQASTVSASLPVETVQDAQTLPPDEAIEDIIDDQDQASQEVTENKESTDVAASTGVAETVTESVSLLDPHDGSVNGNTGTEDQTVKEVARDSATTDAEATSGVPETMTQSVSLLEPQIEDEDDVQVTSGKSQEASTLESVSILHNVNHEDVHNGRSKQQKRKHSEENLNVTPTIQGSTIPEVSSAPITVNLDDSEEEMLVVRRPKRKCFSLDGSPLKARAKSARAKLTRRTKPSARCRLVEEEHEKSGPEPMDAESEVLSKQITENMKFDIGKDSESEELDNKKEDIDSQETIKKSLSKIEQSEDLHLVNTIPDTTQTQESMEDIFNRNTEDTCAAACLDSEDVISQKAEMNVTSVTKSATDTPQQISEKSRRSRYSDSDSDSDDTLQPASVRKGVRAVRGLAARRKNVGKSPVVLGSLNSPLRSESGSKADVSNGKQGKNKENSKLQPEELTAESMSSRRQVHINASECVGPTPQSHPELVSHKSEDVSKGKRAKNSGFTALGHTDSEDSDDADVTIIQSSGSELSGKSQKSPRHKKLSKKKQQTVKRMNSFSDCQVGISPSLQIIDEELVEKEAEISQDYDSQRRPSKKAPQEKMVAFSSDEEFVLADKEEERSHDGGTESRPPKKAAQKDTVYSSSDEEFVLCNDDEVIRKADMPTLIDTYAELPQSSSPIHASSPRREESEEESDVAPPAARKSSRCPIISDSDSDDDSCHSDQQMNFTSSSAFSSQSEVLTTQQQGKLERDMEDMREKIRHLEALNTVLETEGPEEGKEVVLECSKDTPDVIPPTNKTKDDDEEDSSSDGELFLSPLSPSPPPPVTSTSTSTSHTSKRPKDRKEQEVIDAFNIIEKYKSPEISKMRKFGGNGQTLNRKDYDEAEISPALKRKGVVAQKEEKNIDESDLPSVKSPVGRVKKERVSMPDCSSSSRKVLSPLVFGNKKKATAEKINLITSGLTGEQMVSVQQFLGKTGSVYFPKLNKTVTHVIVRKASGEQDQICDRTLKYFQGVVSKCWMVSFDWVRDSLLAGKPVPEGPYEMVGDTVSGEHHYGPKRSRTTEKKLFAGFAFACIGVSKEMTKEDMTALVQLGGAEVAEDAWELGTMKSCVRLIIRCLDYEDRPNQSEMETFGNFYKHFHLVTVSREWVLDSISAFRIQSLKDDYVLTTVRNLVLPF